ncbi:MAG: Ig-like domain-containing protein [Verrucomicrobiota bacterium]
MDNQGTVKLRFYNYNGIGGTTGSRPKISLDNVAVTSVPDGSLDTTPPTVTTLSPTNNATGVTGPANLVATFNEIVAVGTGNIVITKTTGDVVFATIPVGDPQVSFSGNTVTINPTVDLDLGTSYYITIDSQGIKDAAGNFFTGIANNSTWTFTTIPPDLTAPTVVSFTPANNVVNIAPPSSLSINFSETVQLPFAIGPVIKVKKLDGTVVATLDSYAFGNGVSTTGSTATLTLPSGLDYGLTYYVEIDPGSFEDESGNPFAGFTGDTTWKFSTVDVPGLTTTPYTQTFATYTSAATLPTGWSSSGPPGYVSDYRGDWGTVTVDPGNPSATLGGFKGNASVFGYHHNSATGTSLSPLVQILTLRNATPAPITDLTVAYKGRVSVLANTRIPVFTVTVNGVPVTALGYSTTDGDNVQRNASISGLSIPVGATFQIKWSSLYAAGSGSARQIGISDVLVSATSTLFAPTVASLSVPVATIGSLTAAVQADVIGDGGQTVTGRGFVYSVTSTNPAPQIGGPGVSTIVDGSPATGAFSGTLTGLTPATNYTVSAYASNATGTSYTVFATFTTLASSPTFTGSYTQAFNNYDGTNPAGWTAISDATPPLQAYAGTWGQQASTGGFLGGVTPGVLGYRHTGSSGTLTVTLRLINGTGATLTSFDVSYLGRVNDIEEGRNPIWTVAVNGSAPIAALAYDTAGHVDATKTATVTGLSIAPGEEFSITWKSDRGAGAGSSKQIGIGAVAISVPATPYPYASWVTANSGVGGPNGDHDNDGVRNSLEYFMQATGSTFTANPTIVGGTITWPKDPGFVGSYTVQTSPDLAIWTDVSSTVIGNTVTYTPTGPGKVFVRLQVVVTP